MSRSREAPQMTRLPRRAAAAIAGVLLAGCSDRVSPGEDAAAEGLASGAALYARSCAVCHRDNGEGLPGVFPPLARSDYLAGQPKRRLIELVLNGMSGPMTVNGRQYDAVMPPMRQHTDAELASILSYVLNSWGNPGGRVSAEEVAAARAGSVELERTP